MITLETGWLRAVRDFKLCASGISLRAQSRFTGVARTISASVRARFSTRGLERWQNVANHNEYARRLFANESPVASFEKLTPAMKRTEHIALGLRTREGIGVHTIGQNQAERLISDGLLSAKQIASR